MRISRYRAIFAHGAVKPGGRSGALCARRRLGRARGLHSPDPVRRRARDPATGPQRSDPDPHDARSDLRPDDRHGSGASLDLFLGRQSRAWARCTACATPSSKAGRNRSKSWNTAMPPWPTPTKRAPRDCRARYFAAIAAPTCPASIRRSSSSPARSPARHWRAYPRCGPTSRIIHAQKADREGNVLIEGIVGVQKEAVLAAQRAVVTVEEMVDDFGPRSSNAVILPSWTYRRSGACARRRAALVRARLLRARQRVLHRLG